MNSVVTEKRSFLRHMIISGIGFYGGFFAIIMLLVDCFFIEQPESIGTYLSSGSRWFAFVVHAILFGSIMGTLTWFKKGTASQN